MAHESWKIEEFEILADTLAEAARIIREASAKARRCGMTEVVSQGRLVFESRARLLKFAKDMEMNLDDQYASRMTNTPTRWEINRAKHEEASAREIAKAAKESRKAHAAVPGEKKGRLAGRAPAKRKKD
ncbi:hypothetical protein UFOVP1229_43 [uncultured Caudovirales phage]|uniref:Uncharacterized protein n=1 Tax=uncultured Caudovirales phage TaxID=2100421 RepID=A0A6J5R6V9_9CAUD|nr:hypothetical protein UFOVP1229_43 [uncultured Caudovirales phage]